MKTLYIRICWSLLLFTLSGQGTALGQSSTFFLEDFDGVSSPSLPPGWVDDSSEWVTSSSVASTGSGGNNLTVSGTQQATIQTPVLNLSGLSEGTFEYLARRTSTYPLDSLLVLASIDGGTTFSVTLLGQGEALPGTDGNYDRITMAVPASLIGEAQVVLQFIALGGTTSGSNIRIDDVQVSGQGDPTAGNSAIGFSASTSTIDQTTGIAEVPVFLDFENAERLQGLQVELSWDVSELAVNNVSPGPAISNSSDWSFSYHVDGDELRVVLLGNNGASLSEGLYDPLFVIAFSLDGSSSSMEAALEINTAIGSLGVPTGDDAGLILLQETHVIVLDPGEAEFSPSATELDAGETTVANTAVVALSVSNTGNTNLVISEIMSSNSLFSIVPTSATIEPGSSEAFSITFLPTFTDFGSQQSTLTFQHNAQGDSTDINVIGAGIGGRGDVSLDGAVDVLDLVLGIDYVLGITSPGTDQVLILDAFPFDSPDGGLDVRDLTVLSQAILSGIWPDGISIPVDPGSNAALGKDDSPVFIQSLYSEEGSTFFLYSEQSVRAVQFAITMDVPSVEPTLPGLADPAMSMQWQYDAWAGELRVLAYRLDGGSFDPGSTPILDLPGYTGDLPMQFSSGTAVIEGPLRTSLFWMDAQEVFSEEQEVDRGKMVGVPYPNPFNSKSSEEILVAVTLEDDQVVVADVYDLLGRQVAVLHDNVIGQGEHQLIWNGKDHHNQPVSAGLYLMRIQSGAQTVTRLITIF